MTFYLDFDLTVNAKEFPDLGEPVPNSIETIKALIDNNNRIILNTARAHYGQKYIDGCYQWFNKFGIHLDGNTKAKLKPMPYPHSMSILKGMNKLFYQNPTNCFYIDDIAPGTPMTKYNNLDVVDWTRISEDFKRYGIIIDRSLEEGVHPVIYRQVESMIKDEEE